MRARFNVNVPKVRDFSLVFSLLCVWVLFFLPSLHRFFLSCVSFLIPSFFHLRLLPSFLSSLSCSLPSVLSFVPIFFLLFYYFLLFLVFSSFRSSLEFRIVSLFSPFFLIHSLYHFLSVILNFSFLFPAFSFLLSLLSPFFHNIFLLIFLFLLSLCLS